MKLTKQPLNIPLHKRSYTGLLFIIASIVLGIVYIKPSTPIAWITAIGVMAPTFWFVFVGPKFLYSWQSRSQYVFVGWFIIAAKLAFFGFMASTVLPYVESTIAESLTGR